MTRGKRVDEIRKELIEMAKKEAQFLWRMARKAEEHGCSADLIKEIMGEAGWCCITSTAYPERLVDRNIAYDLKYAFKIR